MLFAILAQKEATFFQPPQGSTWASVPDWLFNLLVWNGVFFFALILGIMLYMIARFRKRPGHKPQPSPSHNLALELTWSIIPLIIVIAVFIIGMRGYMDLSTSWKNAYEIQVNASKWRWSFGYHTGLVHNELHLAKDTRYRLLLTSQDVIHSFFVPEFRMKRDVVPGRLHRLWVEPTIAGRYNVFCAEYCGKDHSLMIAPVVVHETKEDFLAWVDGTSKEPLDELTEEELADYLNVRTADDMQAFMDKYPERQSLAEKLKPAHIVGEEVFRVRGGCVQCHSIDGKANTGPTFDGLWERTDAGRTEFRDGKTLKDLFSDSYTPEDYLRESILEPGKHVVKGYDNVMPTAKGLLTDRQIIAVIQYVKSLHQKPPDAGSN